MSKAPAAGRPSELAKHAEKLARVYGGERVVSERPQGGYVVVSTGSLTVDYALRSGGWVQGRIHELVGPPDVGKGHPLSTMILAPSGWRPLGQFSSGHLVIGSDGKPVRVTAVHKRGILRVYKVIFSDGASVRCDGDHLWRVQTKKMRRRDTWYVKSTRELLETSLFDGQGRARYYIPLVSPVQHESSDLPVDPYLAGVLLGNAGFTSSGVISLNPADRDIIEIIEKRTSLDIREYPPHAALRFRAIGIKKMIRLLGQENVKSAGKYVPSMFMTASEEDRRAFLAGLMDTDGSVVSYSSNSAGNAIFHSTSRELSLAVRELTESLGGIARFYENERTDRNGRSYTEYRVSVLIDQCPFWSSRKSSSWKIPTRGIGRSIISIEPDGEEEVWCLSVDAHDSLYVTERHIVTHNSTLAINSMKEQQRAFPDRAIAYLDVEGTFDYDWAEGLGLDTSSPERWRHLYPGTSEEASDMIRECCRSGLYSIAVVDSIGGMESKKALDKDAEDDLVGKNAQVVTRMVKHLASLARLSSCTVLLINQHRANISSYGGNVSAGPKAMQHATSTKITMSRTGEPPKKIRFAAGEDPETVAVQIRARVDRSKLVAPGRVAEFWISNRPTEELGPPGIYALDEYATLGIKLGAIVQKGAWYQFPNSGPQVQGRENVVLAMRADNSLLDSVRSAIFGKEPA